MGGLWLENDNNDLVLVATCPIMVLGILSTFHHADIIFLQETSRLVAGEGRLQHGSEVVANFRGQSIEGSCNPTPV